MGEIVIRISKSQMTLYRIHEAVITQRKRRAGLAIYFFLGVLAGDFPFLEDSKPHQFNEFSQKFQQIAYVAQSAERQTLNLVVAGSSPAVG